MQTFIAVLLVAGAVCYMTWQWMSARTRKLVIMKLTGATDERSPAERLVPAIVQRSACGGCSTCSACDKGA